MSPKRAGSNRRNPPSHAARKRQREVSKQTVPSFCGPTRMERALATLPAGRSRFEARNCPTSLWFQRLSTQSASTWAEGLVSGLLRADGRLGAAGAPQEPAFQVKKKRTARNRGIGRAGRAGKSGADTRLSGIIGSKVAGNSSA